MIRVFVRASSAVELAGLEALVRSASSLQLIGSSLGRTQPGVSSGSVDPDVLLESPMVDEGDDPKLGDAAETPPARVWIVAEPDFAAGLAAVREGTVRALLPAWSSAQQIRSAIESAASGLIVLHPDIAGWRLNSVARASEGFSEPGQQVSHREGEVLNLLAEGLGNKQIAARLGISEHTVKFHVTSIFNKLGASSRAEAVAIGVRRGLIAL